MTSRVELADAMDRAVSDPRLFQALLTRLETDPDPAIRQDVAWYLTPRAGEEGISQALRAANAEDEDIYVRWMARYALRLADRQTAEDLRAPLNRRNTC